MLVLTRKPGETIVIGDNIRLTVVALGPGRVKLGIEAPASVKIDREEVHTRKQSEDEPTPSVVLHNRIAEQMPAVESRAARPLGRSPIRKPR